MEVIDIRELFFVVKKRMGIIFLITIISIITSALVSVYVLEPVYETYTTMMVGKTKSQESLLEYSDVLLSQKLVKTYGEIAKSKSVLKVVKDDLKLEIGLDELKEQISVNSVKDTEIIMIKVQNTDPKMARNIANHTARIFKRQVIQIMKVDNVQIIDKAEIPEEPIKPRKTMNVAIAGVLGLMVSFGLVFLLEYLDNTIKNPEDVEKHLGLPVIGTIPQMDNMNKKKIKKEVALNERFSNS
ncbi:YveK family protein [Anaeromicrobium sediminis]|nr:GNVR domain-containing protein [Anaeromicrobium sediminis]